MNIFKIKDEKNEALEVSKIKNDSIENSKDSIPSLSDKKNDTSFENPFSEESKTDEKPKPTPFSNSNSSSNEIVDKDKQSENPKTNQDELSSFQNQISPPTLSKLDIKDLIDETIEKVIDERWSEIVDKVDGVVNWKKKAQENLDQVLDDLSHLKEIFSKFEVNISQKISNYDGDLLNVSAEIKSLEKVFQKITPSFVENINELKDITQELRKIKNDNYKTNFN